MGGGGGREGGFVGANGGGGGGGREGGLVGANGGVEGQIFILIPKLVVLDRIDNKNCSELFYPLIFYL